MSSFERWWHEVAGSNQLEKAACCLSTTGRDGQPNSRMVLLRGHGPEGFYFFTNYQSEKAREISENSRVALNFHWHLPLHRQVRVQGAAELASSQVSDDYFRSRPRESQISAWLSPQSQVIDGRDELLSGRQALEERFAGKEVPRPEFWGGFLVRPERVEFWVEEAFRFHHRVRFVRSDSGEWRSELLAP